VNSRFWRDEEAVVEVAVIQPTVGEDDAERAPVPLPNRKPPDEKEVAPVPPFATERVPAEITPPEAERAPLNPVRVSPAKVGLAEVRISWMVSKTPAEFCSELPVRSENLSPLIQKLAATRLVVVALEVVRLAKESPVPWAWVKRKFWKLLEAAVEVAAIVPVRRLPMEEVDSVA